MRFLSVLVLAVLCITASAHAQSITKQALKACYEVSTREAQVSCLQQKVKEARALLIQADEKALAKAKNLDQIAIFKESGAAKNVETYRASQEAFGLYLKAECLRSETWVTDPAAAHDVAAFCIMRLIEGRVKRLES